MQEINKKKILKFHSYKNTTHLIKKEFDTMKSDMDENKLNMSVLKGEKNPDDKKVIKFSKFKIINSSINPVQISSNANESLLKTNDMKNKIDSVESHKKNNDNKIMNSNNEFTNNYVISTNNKTLYRNKSQEELSTNLLHKKKYINIHIRNNDSHEENFFELDSINDIKNAINSQLFQNTKTNKSNKAKNLLSYHNNQESFGNYNNNTNSAYTQYPFKKITPNDNEKTLPLLNRINKRKNNISFLIKSRKDKTTAKDIIIHYLKENERDSTKNIPLNNFKRYLDNIDYGKFNYGLDKIYGNSQKFLRRIDEIKKNNIIAYKNDFNIEDYQNTLLKILKKRVNQNSYIKLQTSYKLFNERNYGMIIPRGRYIDLAEKLKDFLSKDIYEKMKRTDKKYVLYLYKKKDQRHKMAEENKNRDNFYKKINKTLGVFNRKQKRNKSN